MDRISDREIQIINLIAHEQTTREIAATLFLSTHTIDAHKKNIKMKLAVKNTAGLVRRAFEMGILSLVVTE